MNRSLLPVLQHDPRHLDLPLLQNRPAARYFTESPQKVSIEITGRCNLRCRHCFNDSGPDSDHELPLDRIESLLDEVQSWQVTSIRITGGEPTVHRRFRDVIAACERRKIGVGLNTNGIYSPEMLDYLKSAPVEMFFVSLDGLEANNDAIRGRGTFRRAIETCRELKSAGQRVMVGFHVGEGNREDVPGLVAVVAELGIDLKVAPLRPVGRALHELPQFLIQPRNFYTVIRQLTFLRRQYPHIHIYTDFDLLDGPPHADCARDGSNASCAAGRSMINIRSDGAINPCAFFDHLGERFTEGNIYCDSATSIWRDPSTFAEFRTQQKSAECHECGHYQRRCNGGCPAISYSVRGHLDALDPTCFADLIVPETFPELEDPVPPLPFARFVAPPEGGVL